MKRFIAAFWPFEQYRDVNRGSLFERSAALRHNRELARALPGYINRWAMVSAVLLIVTQVTPGQIGSLCGVLFTVSFCAVVHCAHVWVLFKRLS